MLNVAWCIILQQSALIHFICVALHPSKNTQKPIINNIKLNGVTQRRSAKP